MASSTSPAKPGNIVFNHKARHNYHLLENFEAGIALQGWEVKSLRTGRCQLVDNYVQVRGGEVWLIGARIDPLPSASSHVATDPDRSRKLLLKEREISRLLGLMQQKGYTCIAIRLYWKGHLVKCEVALARGKRTHDKRAASRERDWQDRQRKNLRRLQRRGTG